MAEPTENPYVTELRHQKEIELSALQRKKTPVFRGVLMYFPTQLTIKKNGTTQSSSTIDWQTQGVVVTLTPSQVGGDIVGTWEIVYSPLPTYDLNMRNVQGASTSPTIFPYNFAANRGTRVFAVVYQ
jgi:hypothetical protein